MAVNLKVYFVGIVLGCLIYAWFLMYFKRDEVSKISTIIKQEYNISFPSHLRESLHWNTIAPDDLTHVSTLNNPLQLKTEADLFAQEQSSIEQEPTSNVLVGSPPEDAQNVVEDTFKTKCTNLKVTYFVVPGSSWGSLSVDLQKQWTEMKCDELVVESAVVDAQKEKAGSTSVEEAVAVGKDKKSKRRRKKGGDQKLGERAGLPVISETNREWCQEALSKYTVKPMRSWGSMPKNEIDAWTKRKCDLVFSNMGKRKISSCLPPATKDKKKAVNPNLSDSLPLIAIMAATTTRKVHAPSTQNMALFTYLLPSVVRTLDCGYRYEYVLGYDKGDPFYDSEKGMEEVKQWFKDHVEDPMAVNGIRITLRLVKVNNTLKKPGPVFNEMARAAYAAGAAFFYRVNDDTELLVNWANAFVTALKSLPAPYGALGPSCSQGNNKILTHDFTCRLHMEIFEMNYYPPELTDWWMDDWISLVYGQARTFKASQVPVIHHTGAHGQRYTVDSSHEGQLVGLVQSGRTKIRQWMLKNKVAESDLVAFDKDVYRAGFPHRDLPGAVKKRLR